MASPDGRAKGRSDADGVRVERRPARAWDVWLLVGVGVVAVGWLLMGRGPAGEPPAPVERPAAPVPPQTTAHDDPTAGADVRGAAAGSTTTDGALPASPHRRRVLARRLARQLPRTTGPEGKPELDARDAIAALHAAGIHDGIAAFPPPGTDPPRSGVIVPEAFVLPEGFIRHYQTTDEGEALPPILLMHPDYELIGPDGEPIPLPPDRVVPPELVPEGMPIEELRVPEHGTGRTP